MKPRIRLHGFLIFICVMVLLLNFRLLIPKLTITAWDDVVDALALFLIVWGFAIRVAARGYKSRFSEGGQRLVTTGPYAAVRHPMYLGVLMIGTGVCVMILPLWMLAVFYGFMGVVYLREAVKEEENLQQTFGMEYFVYKEAVPALFPNDWRAVMRLFIGLDRKALWREAPGMIGVAVFVIAVETVQHHLARAGHPWPMELCVNVSVGTLAAATVMVLHRLARNRRMSFEQDSMS